MSNQPRQLELLSETHRNHFLFSDYFLNHRVDQQPEWRDVDARAALEAVTALWRAFTPQADNEAQTELEWIRPVLADLGGPGKKLNQKLSAWWGLDFPAFRRELKKAFKRDVLLKERDDWEAWLAGRRAEHARLTAEIVRLETELNARVYAVYGLSAEEVRVVEESTKYGYGEG